MTITNPSCFLQVKNAKTSENYLCDLMVDRDNILYILFICDKLKIYQICMKLKKRLCDFWKEIIKGFAESGVDGIFFSDDVGDQRSMIISPQIWRDVLKPLYKEMIDTAHERGLHVPTQNSYTDEQDSRI
jgi:hypothetical protein